MSDELKNKINQMLSDFDSFVSGLPQSPMLAQTATQISSQVHMIANQMLTQVDAVEKQMEMQIEQMQKQKEMQAQQMEKQIENQINAMKQQLQNMATQFANMPQPPTTPYPGPAAPTGIVPPVPNPNNFPICPTTGFPYDPSQVGK